MMRPQKFYFLSFSLVLFLSPAEILSENVTTTCTSSSISSSTSSSTSTTDDVTTHVTNDVITDETLVRILANKQQWSNIAMRKMHPANDDNDDDNDEVNDDDEDNGSLVPMPKLLKLRKKSAGTNVDIKPRKVDAKCECGTWEQTASRIINGSPVGKEKYPFLVSIQVKKSGFHFCGGAIISDSYVLTAAHCTDGLKQDDMQVVVGEHNLSIDDKTEKIYDVLEIKQHRRFQMSTMNFDISLLKLAKTIKYSSAVRSVCLTPPDLVYFNEKVTVMGWGKTDENNDHGSDVLMEAEVRVLPMLRCRNDYGFTPEMITSKMICAAGETTDGCQGDSGGPLIYKDEKESRYVQIGVTSWGIGCGRPEFPGVYTKLIKFLEWIYENTKDSVFCSTFTPEPDKEVEVKKKGDKNNSDKNKNKNGGNKQKKRIKIKRPAGKYGYKRREKVREETREHSSEERTKENGKLRFGYFKGRLRQRMDNRVKGRIDERRGVRYKGRAGDIRINNKGRGIRYRGSDNNGRIKFGNKRRVIRYSGRDNGGRIRFRNRNNK